MIREVKIVCVREGNDETAISQPGQVAEFWRQNVAAAAWYDADKENMVVLLLNNRNAVCGWNLVSIGTVNRTEAHAREIFRAAIVAAATGVILAHNHPGGDPTPSQADRDVTEQLKHVGEIIGINVLDHVVVAGEHAYSITSECEV